MSDEVRTESGYGAALRRRVWLCRDAISDRVRGTNYRRRVFERIYAGNLWGDQLSVSGGGSSPDGSAAVRVQLPDLFRKYGVRSVLDAPCGDFLWMRELVTHLDDYVGVDIVPNLIARNSRLYANEKVRFACADISADTLPSADLILCRDCLIHLPTRLVWKTMQRFCATGARFVLFTNDTSVRNYHDIAVGSFRPINLQLPPFGLPEPLYSIDENGQGRCLSLWDLRLLRQSLSWPA